MGGVIGEVLINYIAISVVVIFIFLSILIGLWNLIRYIDLIISNKLKVKLLKGGYTYVLDLLGRCHVNLKYINSLIYRVKYKIFNKFIKYFIYTIIIIAVFNHIKINWDNIVNYFMADKVNIFNLMNRINKHSEEILNIILIFCIIATSSLKKSLRRKVKEDNYYYVIEKYLELRNILLNSIYINEDNEEILLRILRYCKDELKGIEDRYKDYLFVFLNTNRYEDDMKKMKSELNNITNIKDLKTNDIDPNEKNKEFNRILTSKSRINIINSINKKLLWELYYLSTKTVIELSKDKIANGIIKRGKEYDIVIENLIINSFINRHEILKIIQRIDKKTGINKKENNLLEMIKNYTDSLKL